MADYRDHYPEIQAAGATVVAASVDPPAKSEQLRSRLSVPFEILYDTERRVIKEWDIYNAGERGGIAKPAVFILDRERLVRYASVDSVARRVPASEIVRILQTAGDVPLRRRVQVPQLSNWLNAIRNHLRG